MMNDDALFIPASEASHKILFLTRQVLAVQLAAVEHGGIKLGPISHLRTGAALELCGSGFTERTTKVRANGNCYFVLSRDIQEAGEYGFEAKASAADDAAPL